MHFHPKADDHGKQVAILHPSKPSQPSSWTDPTRAATVVPGGAMPAELNGIPFQPWQAPTTAEEWAAVEGQAAIEGPEFTLLPGKLAAAGVVIEEPDGRVWLVSPTNGFGGYKSTFPKGRPETGASLQACAIREAFEESGIKVEITGFLADLPRSTTRTRYYLARRTAGNPSNAGRESQAMRLVPRANLGEYLTNPNDAPFIKLLGG